MRLSLILLILMVKGILTAQTVPYNLIPDWISQPNGQIATGLGLADIDGDGYKDLVIANGNDIQRQKVTVHYNDGAGNFNINPDWQSDDVDYHGHLACGDVDNDGDIDVAVSVYIGPAGFSEPGKLKVYYNLGTQLQNYPSFVSDPFYTFSCALGDADGDGDLDIAAVAGEPYSGLLDHGRIFYNENGTFQPSAEWQSESMMGALDVEFGDFNRDGFTDVIFVCEGTPNMIYLADDSGIIDKIPDWESSETVNYINSVDVGYENSLCQVVMTENNQLGGEGRVRKYDFTPTIPETSSASWYSEPFGYGSGIFLNDADNDNHTDLIYGGWWLPVKVALGDGSGYELTTSYTSSTSSVVEAIQLSDLDRVDELPHLTAITISAEHANTNMVILGSQLVERIESVYRNSNLMTVQDYKHVTGKPWVIFSSRLQEGEQITINYKASNYPDMVITNWDSNKGDYIFYNTESTVGMEDNGLSQEGMKSMLKVWPVPVVDELTVVSRESGVGSRESAESRLLEVYSFGGAKVVAKSWPVTDMQIKLDVSHLAPGAYFLLLKSETEVLAKKMIIISR